MPIDIKVRPGREDEDSMQLDARNVRDIIHGNTVRLVEVAEGLGQKLSGLPGKDRLSTSQIRNVYGTVKRMQFAPFDRAQLLLLKPKLAYAARKGGQGIRELRDVLNWAIDSTENEEHFEQFVQFFEAILAYHQAADGEQERYIS